jgi:hypothetical protein
MDRQTDNERPNMTVWICSKKRATDNRYAGILFVTKLADCRDKYSMFHVTKSKLSYYAILYYTAVACLLGSMVQSTTISVL